MDELLRGWKNIARFLGISKRTALRRKKELKKEGIIFYRWFGSPPRREVTAYTSELKRWLREKTICDKIF